MEMRVPFVIVEKKGLKAVPLAVFIMYVIHIGREAIISLGLQFNGKWLFRILSKVHDNSSVLR